MGDYPNQPKWKFTAEIFGFVNTLRRGPVQAGASLPLKKCHHVSRAFLSQFWSTLERHCMNLIVCLCYLLLRYLNLYSRAPAPC